MATQEPLSLLEILQKATQFLKNHSVDQARLHAEYLLADLLNIPRLELYLQFERILSEEILDAFREALKRRSKGIPLQHLLGSSEFFGKKFFSDSRALIPRPETEQLVERALLHLKKFSCHASDSSVHRLLDVGTGSGVIAITLALEHPTAQIEAIDLSSDALALAQKNATHHQVSNITWHHASLLEAFASQNNQPLFNLIIANLPYIPSQEISTLDREVQYDPKMALDGGKNGLELITQLIAQAQKHLIPGGILLLEIGKGQAEAVLHSFKENHYENNLALADYQGVSRFVEGRRPLY